MSFRTSQEIVVELRKYYSLTDVFDILIVRDIHQKYKIRNVAQSLNNYNDKINYQRVGNYLKYLCNTFAFYKFRRYDIKGKKISFFK